MSLEENATPESSPESNNPLEKTEAVQEETATPACSKEQATEPVEQPNQTEQSQQNEAVESETSPDGRNVDAPTEETAPEPAVELSNPPTCSDDSATNPAKKETTAPRVSLNPLGAEQAKAVPSIATSESDKTREEPKPAVVETEAEKPEVSAERVPPAEPVDIPATEQLDSALEAELNAALQGAESVTDAEGADTANAGQSAALNMPKDDAELEPGLKLKGKVDAVDDENIVVDIGYRMSGILSKRNLEGVEVPEAGATIDVVVGSVDLEEGLVHLAMPKAIHRAGGDWNAIAVGQVVECTVEKTNKGGLSVLVSQLRGFMPAGQVDLHFVGDLEPYVGQKLTAKVIDVNPKKKNLVVSRKAILQEEREQQAAAVWENLTEGEQRTGTVKTIKEYGAFVDIGGVDGLLHVREMGWTRVNHPSDLLKQGQQVEVKVLKIDREKKKISLSMKQLLANPWDHAEQKFAKNTVVTGVVKKITDFGAFVEIEEGLEGLIHVSELDYRRVNKVSDVLTEGEEVEAQVLEVNKNKRRISLSVKALKPKPQASPEKIAQQKAEAAEEKRRREEAEKRRLTLKGGNSSSEQGGGLFGNPGDFSN